MIGVYKRVQNALGLLRKFISPILVEQGLVQKTPFNQMMSKKINEKKHNVGIKLLWAI